MGLLIFRDTVVEHAQVRPRLLKLMLDAITTERSGGQIDRILLKHTVNMLVELGVQNRPVYHELFEQRYLAETGVYYEHEASNFIAGNTCPDYLKKAETRIKE